MSRDLREAWADNLMDPCAAEVDWTAMLKADGIAIAPWPLSADQIDETLNYLAGTIVRNAHVWAKGKEERPFGEVFERGYWPMFCHHMQDVVIAPHFFEAALDGYEVARDYFGEPPRLYSMNAFWTQPAPGVEEYRDTHDWHRDGDDRKQLVMFMYGTRVRKAKDGAHRYVRGTADTFDGNLDYSYNDPPADLIETVKGEAGTCFFSDTRGLHMGLRPSHPRMLAWARWGVSERPPSYDWDELQPVPQQLLGSRYPQDPELQRAIELVTR